MYIRVCGPCINVPVPAPRKIMLEMLLILGGTQSISGLICTHGTTFQSASLKCIDGTYFKLWSTFWIIELLATNDTSCYQWGTSGYPIQPHRQTYTEGHSMITHPSRLEKHVMKGTENQRTTIAFWPCLFVSWRWQLHEQSVSYMFMKKGRSRKKSHPLHRMCFHQNQISPAVLGRLGDRLLPHVRQPASQVAGFIILLSSR